MRARDHQTIVLELEPCVAPTALARSLDGDPALTGWARLWRTSSALDGKTRGQSPKERSRARESFADEKMVAGKSRFRTHEKTVGSE